MQVLCAHGQSDSGLLWRMLGSLVTMQRPDLYPQAQSQEGLTASVQSGLHQLLDRCTMGGRRRRTMAARPQDKVSEEKDAIAKAEKHERQSSIQKSKRRRASRFCRWERPREGKRSQRWCSCLWTFAAIYAVDDAAHSTLPTRAADIYGINFHCLTAFWQSPQRQGRCGIDCTTSSTCSSTWSFQRAVRGSQESFGCDRIQHQERRCQELQTADLPADTGSQTSCRHRRAMGCLQDAVDDLSRHCHEDVDGTYRILRGRRNEIFSEEERGCDSPATGKNATTRNSCENDVSRRSSTFRRTPRRADCTRCHHDHLRHGHCRRAAAIQSAEDRAARSCAEGQRDHRGETSQEAPNLRGEARRRCADCGDTRCPSTGIYKALTLHASDEEAEQMKYFINEARRGEGRVLRRTKWRCLAFWPTVSTIHHQGQ